MVWKLDRLGRFLSHLIHVIEEPKAKGAAFRSLTEQMDTTTPHREFPVQRLRRARPARAGSDQGAGHDRACRRPPTRSERGRPPALDPEKDEQIIAAFDGPPSKASVCRSFKVPRSTLIDTLNRVGWTGTGASAQKLGRSTPIKVA